MQKQPDLAVNLLNLFDISSYKEFGEGFFVNQPKMHGYYYIFKKLTKPKFCLIVNTSSVEYPSNMSQIKDYIFIVITVPSIEEYMENFANKYFPEILGIIDTKLQKENTRNLPYGYYIDENGDMKIDLKKAAEVRRIYDMYIENPSVRDIAAQLDTNFSFIREILHSNEDYMQMQQKFLPISKLRKVNELLAQNIRGGAQKKMTTQDEIEEVRRKRKQKERMNAIK